MVNLALPGFEEIHFVEFETSEKIKLRNWHKNEIIAKQEIIKKLIDKDNAWIQKQVPAKAINDLARAYCEIKQRLYDKIRITGFNIAI